MDGNRCQMCGKLLYAEKSSDSALGIDAYCYGDHNKSALTQCDLDAIREIVREEVSKGAHVGELERLVHDYQVFCNTPFIHVAHAAGEDFLEQWKQDRDALRARAKALVSE